MRRIDTANKAADLFGAGKHGWRNGDQGLGINATEFNAEFQNAIQEELASVVEAAGLALIPAANTQLLEAIQRLIDVQSGNYALDTGVANAYVVALDPAIAAYTNGMTVRFRIANAVTGASTLDAGAGAVPLVNDVGGALVSGDGPIGGILEATYDSGLNKFLINSLVPSQAMSQTAADARYAALDDRVKPGTLIDWAGMAAPSGYLACPTAAGGAGLVARTGTYAALFAAIGTTWGAGDGATTFQIPYFPGDYAAIHAPASVGQISAGAVISHTHNAKQRTNTGTYTGATGADAGDGSRQDASLLTSATGGAANLAAGMRVMKCVKY